MHLASVVSAVAAIVLLTGGVAPSYCAEVGPNDFRINDRHGLTDNNYQADVPAAAFDPTLNRYLVVWQTNYSTIPTENGELEIWGRFVGRDGTNIGNQFRISESSSPNLNEYAAFPEIVFNPETQEYLVVWMQFSTDYSDIPGGGVVSGSAMRPFVRRLNNQGVAVAAEHKIGAGWITYGQFMRRARPRVAINPADNEYFVVWAAAEDTFGFEVFGRRLDFDSTPLGSAEIPLSLASPGQTFPEADNPAIAWSPENNVYLLTFAREGGNYDIVGQLFLPDGSRTGPTNFLISPHYDGSAQAFAPDVCWNPNLGEFAVAWAGEGSTNFQRVDAAGNLRTPNNVQLSDLSDPRALYARIGWSPALQRYLVYWLGGPTNALELKHRGVGTDGVAIGQPASLLTARKTQELGLGRTPDMADCLAVFDAVPDASENDSEYEIFAAVAEGGTASPPGGYFQVSQAGTGTTTIYDALEPDVAWNETLNQFFAVFEISRQGNSRIYGRGFNWNGVPIQGQDVALTPANVSASADAGNPAVAWNATENEYFAVWIRNPGGTVFGAVLNSAGAAEPTVPVSATSTIPNVDVAWNRARNEYLVVWDDVAVGTRGIYVQRIAANGAQVGPDDSRITGLAVSTAQDPSVVYNELSDEYLVVWQEDIGGEQEIVGARLNSLGSPMGLPFRVSHCGPDLNFNFRAHDPEAVWRRDGTGYAVVYRGDSLAQSGATNKYEIYACRLDAAGTPLAPADIQISFTGAAGDRTLDALEPSVEYNAVMRQYFIAWRANASDSAGFSGENEVYYRRLNPDGTFGDALAVRVSDMGPNGDANYAAFKPRVTAGAGGQTMFVWHGNEFVNSGSEDPENNVFGQSIVFPTSAGALWRRYAGD